MSISILIIIFLDDSLIIYRLTILLTIIGNVLATATTGGAVVTWNLNRSSRNKQEHVFNDHRRTVNKVTFHSVESNLLMSGSQDGTIKCFDLRLKEALKTYSWYLK